MAREREEDPGFIVSDRRGTVREHAPSSDPPRPAVPPSNAASAHAAHADEPAHAGPVDFSGLLLSLASTAMVYLGAPGPDGAAAPVNLPRAQEMIDLLAVLEQKTAGNLSADESALLGNLLYTLRMRYVEAAR
ncbi:MAG: DUF1844 domain-containing protein [Nitrospirota bacterium]